ncbi:hypothetical protein ACHAXA_000089 [Cyclostephanos tholiformis]|uniref:Uncharacterized protein n=1 Tax=Cyclostephanos tholiformis TaxID=382380 RepID=A0ABD3RW36_9STRA
MNSPPKHNTDKSAESFRELLARLGLPRGLLKSVLACYKSCYLTVRDSYVIVRHVDIGGCHGSHEIEKRDRVTRWQEIQECLSFHSHMAAKCWIRTKLWLVNEDDENGHKFSLCCGSPDDVPDEVSRLITALKHATLAQDQCPLSAQIHKITKIISEMAPALNAHDQKVTVVICTQGLPTNEHGISTRTIQHEFWNELIELSKVPVRTIIRLCTYDKGVSNAYKKMHGRIESMDVLDDYWGEVCMSG